MPKRKRVTGIISVDGERYHKLPRKKLPEQPLQLPAEIMIKCPDPDCKMGYIKAILHYIDLPYKSGTDYTPASIVQIVEPCGNHDTDSADRLGVTDQTLWPTLAIARRMVRNMTDGKRDNVRGHFRDWWVVVPNPESARSHVTALKNYSPYLKHQSESVIINSLSDDARSDMVKSANALNLLGDKPLREIIPSSSS